MPLLVLLQILVAFLVTFLVAFLVVTIGSVGVLCQLLVIIARVLGSDDRLLLTGALLRRKV